MQNMIELTEKERLDIAQASEFNASLFRNERERERNKNITYSPRDSCDFAKFYLTFL